MDTKQQLSQVDDETNFMAAGVEHSTPITTALTRTTESTARRHDPEVIEEVSEKTETSLTTSQTEPASDVGDMRRLLTKSMRGTFTAGNFSAHGILDHATPMAKKVPKPTWSTTSIISATSVAATSDVAASSSQLQVAVDMSTIREITPACGLVEDRQEAVSAAETLTQSMPREATSQRPLLTAEQLNSLSQALSRPMATSTPAATAPPHRISHEQMQELLEVLNEPTTETEMELDAQSMFEAIDHLYENLLDYIVQGSRIFLCHNVETWHEFDRKNNLLDGREITSAELRDIFVKLMLPRIYEYTQYTQKFNLLKCHPHLQRTTTGYIFKSAIKPIKPLTFNVDYRLLKAIKIDEELDKLVKADHIDGVESETSDEEAAAQPRKKFKFETRKSKPLMSNFFVAMGAAGKPELAKPQQKKFCSSTHALLSVVVSKPFEIHNLLLIDVAEILQRLQRAQRQFLSDGQLTVCTNAAELEGYLRHSMRTRDSILNIMNSRC